MSQKYDRSIVILCRILLWIFRKWFMKMLKKTPFIPQQTYLYIPSQTFWSFMAIYFVHIVKVFVSLKTVIMLIFLCICIKHSQHLEMRKNNSKLNFTKKCWASWFSCGQLKISKCSISLTRLGECSKRRLHHWEV